MECEWPTCDMNGLKFMVKCRITKHSIHRAFGYTTTGSHVFFMCRDYKHECLKIYGHCTIHGNFGY